MDSREPTIHDVARAAGVSPSTVSNVLNGRRERMRAETCERVVRAMAELGYTPNEMARGLKAGFLPTIGLIVPSVANPFWGAFARSVEHAALARNCQVLLCNGERDPVREQQYAESMFTRGIRGLILGSAPLSMKHMVGLVRRGLNVVTFDREAGGSDTIEFDSVRVDNAGGARLAVQHLLDLGHRRIGFISGPISSSSRSDRYEGYRSALLAHGITPDPSLIWTEPVAQADEEGTTIGRLGAVTLLRQPNPPTAFFAINDTTAFGVYAGIREAGLELPRDISVVGFDDIRLCEVVTPTLTSVQQPLDELMRSAVELLLARLEQKQVGPATHITLPAKLIVRSSAAGPGNAKIR